MAHTTDVSYVLADNLRRELEVRGMTQRQLADDIGVSQPRIAEILAGGNPRLNTLHKIATALDLSVAALLSYRVPTEKTFANSR